MVAHAISPAAGRGGIGCVVNFNTLRLDPRLLQPHTTANGDQIVAQGVQRTFQLDAGQLSDDLRLTARRRQ